MDEREWLAKRFEANRTHLRAVAYRMLGSLSDADDAVQQSWVRLSLANSTDLENLRGWLTTVVARISLDMLRSRKARREEPMTAHAPDPIACREDAADPEFYARMADSVGIALLVLLEKLPPTERVAFVLHDMFDLPFDEIAPIVGRSPAAARQLASRARRRVQGATAVPDADPASKQRVVDAFLAASHDGDFDELLRLLDPDVVLRADRAVANAGALNEVRSAAAVADTFTARARFARPALVNGAPGAVWPPDGQPRVEFDFTIAGGKIVEIQQIAMRSPVGEPRAEPSAAGERHRETSEGIAMGILTEDMKRVIREQRLGFVATVCPDGTPNLSPKGTVAVWDDDHLIFVDVRSPNTIANLRQNPAIEINIVDQLVRKGYRFKGTAEVLAAGPIFDEVLASRRDQGAANPMRALVLITVERALPITSPAYDLGVSEKEIRDRYRRYWQELWDGGKDLAGTATLE